MEYNFHQIDCLEYLKNQPQESVDLIVSSPPYNVGKEYEKNLSLKEYKDLYSNVVKELNRILKATGSICWQVGNLTKDRVVLPLDYIFYDLFSQENMILRNRIIWRYEHGLHEKKRFSGRYEVILWFTKSNDYKFNLDSVRIPSKYPGKLHFKGPNKGKPSGNPLGKNPGDIWDIVKKDWENEIWNIPNVKSAHCEKTNHPCQYPIELVERCVLAFTDEGDLICDPFMGVGTTAIAAIKHGRNFVGSERDLEYIKIANNRIQSLKDGTLITREIGTPILKPSGKIARKPGENQDVDMGGGRCDNLLD